MCWGDRGSLTEEPERAQTSPPRLGANVSIPSPTAWFRHKRADIARGGRENLRYMAHLLLSPLFFSGSPYKGPRALRQPGYLPYLEEVRGFAPPPRGGFAFFVALPRRYATLNVIYINSKSLSTNVPEWLSGVSLLHNAARY